MNLGVKALLSWVKATIRAEGEDDINIEDLQNGEILLKLVYLLKKESIPCQSNCEDHFQIISDFIERDCRFNALNGTSITWQAIKDGSNVTVEIAKVLLLLVYHDMMNDHCTLRTLDCHVESQIASLTATYVMESEGSVSLRPGLDAYLARRCLHVSRDIFDKSSTSSVSSVSSVYDEEESPLFTRSQKVQFLDLQQVASSSNSCSPIQDIINTPIFQMRKLQRQLIQDRDYKDGLEKELSSKLALLAHRESQINQLQYCLDQLKEDRGAGEQTAREQIDELEKKNNMLQSRFNDVLKENKELKGNAALIERNIDELAEENGALTLKMKTMCSQLAVFEAEVGRLTETQTSSEVEWRSIFSNLQSKLSEEMAQKELLTEQIEILQGKISCLEDNISRSTQEDEGDNMWISVEKKELENKICMLTDKLENTTNTLQKTEVEIEAKKKQLKDCEQKISDQKELLIQQHNQMGQLIESNNEAVKSLQIELTDVRAVLQQEICTLKLRLEEAEQQKREQTLRLHVQVASCAQEIENLKEIKQQKEEHLHQTEERVKELMTKLYTANNLLADKDQEVSSLTEKVVLLTEMHQQAKDGSLAKEEMLSNLLLEKSQEEEIFRSSIQSLKDQVNSLESSLKQAEETLKMEKDLLSKTCQENGEQMEGLNRNIAISKETIKALKEEIHVKDEQLNEVKMDNDGLQEEICALNSQISSLCESLSDAKQQVQTWQAELTKREEESLHLKEFLEQQLSSSENMVKHLKAEIKTKIEQISLLENQSVKQLALLKSESRDLQQEVAILKSKLTKAEEDLLLKEKDFTSKQQEVEGLQTKVLQFEDELKNLHANIQTKEEETLHLKKEASTEIERIREENLKRSNDLENEIKHLNIKVQSLHESSNSAAEQLTLKQNMLAKYELEISHEKNKLKKLETAFDDELLAFRQQMNANEKKMVTLKNEAVHQSNLHQQEIQSLKDQLDIMAKALSKAEENVQTQLLKVSEQKMASVLEQESLQQKLSHAQEVIKGIENEKMEKDLLSKTCQENGEQMVGLNRNIAISKETIKALKEEIHVKDEQLNEVKMDNDGLQEEICALNSQISSLCESLSDAKQQVQTWQAELTKREEESLHLKEFLEQQLSSSEDMVKHLKAEIKTKIEQISLLENQSVKQLALLKSESRDLQQEVAFLKSKLTKAEEDLLLKENDFTSKQQEVEGLQTKVLQFEDELKNLHANIQTKEEETLHLKKEASTEIERIREENLKRSNDLENEIKHLNIKVQSLHESSNSAAEQLTLKQNMLAKYELEISHEKNKLKKLETAFDDELLAFRQQMNANEKKMVTLKNEAVHQSNLHQQEIQSLKDQLDIMAKALSKAEENVQTQLLKVSEQKMASVLEQESLQQKLSHAQEVIKGIENEMSVKEQQMKELQLKSGQQIDNLKNELVCLNDELHQLLRQKEETLESAQQENAILIKQKETLNTRILAVENQMEVTIMENQRLSEAKQAMEMENNAALNLQIKVQQELQMLKQDNNSLLIEKEKIEVVKQDLLEQLSAKSAAVEHYKAQIEKAVDHYNSKKQLLQQSEEEVTNLKHSLEVQESQFKNVTMENNLLQMELEKIQSNEKVLLNKVATLEAQLSFADGVLRSQTRLQYDQKALEQMPSTLEVPGNKYGINPKTKFGSISSDSLDQSSLDDSLNNTRKLSAPGESSTPLVRSSERLAAKRHTLQAESLETLYFTPINTRHRTTTDSKPKESASSIKRRRTTQVINIVMTKKTPGRNEADETFYSVASARSQPNLSSDHKAQGISTELFTTPKATEADQLIGLPGYRRSTIHSQATSTFCVGAENEPEGGPEDWMRIAEIQSRNKACLPHLKSSYPIEFDTVRNSALSFTDEELRTGDPIETIRRASVMPGQLQDSLTSHRLSYMGQSGATATSRSRLSLMPGQAIPKAVSSSRKSPKGSKRAPSTLTVHPTSPEKKSRASCFPRPLTPKNKNASGAAIPHIQTALSPVDRRQSMMFTIDNTPRKNPKTAESSSHRGQENLLARNGRKAVGGAGKQGSHKSPSVANKGHRKSPQVSAKAAKFPGLTASARKMMSRMKV